MKRNNIHKPRRLVCDACGKIKSKDKILCDKCYNEYCCESQQWNFYYDAYVIHETGHTREEIIQAMREEELECQRI